jgi:hypothetical protein
LTNESSKPKTAKTFAQSAKVNMEWKERWRKKFSWINNALSRFWSCRCINLKFNPSLTYENLLQIVIYTLGHAVQYSIYTWTCFQFPLRWRWLRSSHACRKCTFNRIIKMLFFNSDKDRLMSPIKHTVAWQSAKKTRILRKPTQTAWRLQLICN